MTMQHGSVDTVVRVMSVKYRNWHLGSPVTPKPFRLVHSCWC